MTAVSESKPVRILAGVAAGSTAVAAGLPLLTPDRFDWIGPALGLLGIAIVAGLAKFTEDKVTPNENVAVQIVGVERGEGARSGPGQLVATDALKGIATGAPVTVEPTTAFGEPFDTPPTPPRH